MRGLIKEYEGDGLTEAETPGLKVVAEIPEGLTDAPSGARFRQGAAKLNYLAQSRADLSFASMEVSKRMAKPCASDMQLLESDPVFCNIRCGCAGSRGRTFRRPCKGTPTAIGAAAVGPAYQRRPHPARLRF